MWKRGYLKTSVNGLHYKVDKIPDGRYAQITLVHNKNRNNQCNKAYAREKSEPRASKRRPWLARKDSRKNLHMLLFFNWRQIKPFTRNNCHVYAFWERETF